MKFFSAFRDLTRLEWGIWLCSLFTVTLSFLLCPSPDYLTLAASLIGVTALIFVAKGYVLGQVLTVLFSIFYGMISFCFHYYGEMITYLCMTTPMAILSIISWVRHPFEKTAEVAVGRLSKRRKWVMWSATIAITVAFWFLLKALGNANLTVSTLSVTTSFLASFLTFCRSPYYALAYAANDIVLIFLWVMATLTTPSYLPMIFCFLMFLLNDLYGFWSWRRMERRQGSAQSKV